MARLNSQPKLESRWRHSIGDHVISLAWSSDGSLIAAASVSGPITIFDMATGETKHTLPGHAFGTTAISWHPKELLLASAGQDGKARIWNPVTGAEVMAVAGGSAWVEHIAWSPKGDSLATAAGRKVRLWGKQGEMLRDYPPFASTVSGIEWSARGKDFVVSGYGKVSFYRPDAADVVNTFEWKGSILGLAWSPDGKMLAGGGQDSTVHFWYVKSGDDLQMSGYPMKITAVSWDSTSRYLATNGGEMVIAWDCSGDGPAGSKPLMFERHPQPVADLSFQNRGPVLASGCQGGIIALWYPGGTKKIQAEADFGEGVSKVAWSPGDGRLAIGGEQGGVGLFTV
ncbi:WD40 repeat domain-containing protein [Zavarzinella formosa]|uniref:WD40 repeat domain-containing protein n=1 Tax=Zavarzinella formosa TaxID=360055 RepID=UPI00030D35DC|nr:WD40 repeat domain-containing protein [Zavarzinella formosa]